MLKGKKVYIRPLEVEDSKDMAVFQRDNRAFFEKFSMERGDEFYSEDTQRSRIKDFHEEMLKDDGYYFGIFKQEDDQLAGTINLFQVLRGSLQGAFVGYFIDQKHNGHGFATEAVELIVEYAFKELQLHRIEAGVMPRNIASIRVLEKAGFHKEGIARKNVKINGKWEDHQMLALINPEDE
ncbi:GNAT family N-acetyltransferase [Halobacillus sp. Marseille-Q1614]|uniref:GNAT family N-acetyltransferase n=1 Tax=Halobacillus sp. Marseille-Q1614 TaxID=2709134 RepID=UPI001570BD55|nr:GNAT family protein [Halobacillus sp. Marseille-Q1614]